MLEGLEIKSTCGKINLGKRVISCFFVGKNNGELLREVWKRHDGQNQNINVSFVWNKTISKVLFLFIPFLCGNVVIMCFDLFGTIQNFVGVEASKMAIFIVGSQNTPKNLWKLGKEVTLEHESFRNVQQRKKKQKNNDTADSTYDPKKFGQNYYHPFC